MTFSKLKPGSTVRVITGKHKGFIGEIHSVNKSNKSKKTISLVDLFIIRNLKRKTEQEEQKQKASKKVFVKIDISNVVSLGIKEDSNSSKEKL